MMAPGEASPTWEEFFTTYECQWHAGIDAGNEADIDALPGNYLLIPLDADTYQLALEDWAIWERWEAAFVAGATSQASHPALPDDQTRHKQIEQLLRDKLVIKPDFSAQATGTFSYTGGKTLVEWTMVP